MNKIYFSLNDANEYILAKRYLLDKLVQLRDELDLLDNTKLEVDDDNLENLLLEVELNKNFHEKNLELYKIIGLLIKDGCIVRDLEKMEIDFYSKFGGKDIIFCYTPEDEKILYWHEINQNYENKQSIKEIEQSYFETLSKLK
ncbi:MAG: DUF2203 family protein [Candidatus ainarchaeum sp.]|nr:DUF2203 family protein [Candidatus ainarchaeum sp.]